MLKDTECSTKLVDEMWKEFDYFEKKGVASFEKKARLYISYAVAV